MLKLVVGLGNPGSQYAGTRHNVGFGVISELSDRWQCGKSQLKYQAEIREAVRPFGKVLLVAPMTFMNRSGESVQQIARFFQVGPENIAVICDDMNLPLGRLRWRPGGSSGGQKGLADIVLRLGTEQIPRLRLGVGRPPGNMDPSSWVLSRFRSEDLAEADLMVKLAADSVECWLADGISSVMNRYNRSAEV